MSRTLPEWLELIESFHPAEIELGLDRIRLVADRLQLLPWVGPVVTVAGTNGKGSTVTLLERLAREHGLRTGLYTSPHLHRFNERIRLDGAEAGDDLLVPGFEAVEAARRQAPEVALTYFEFTTLVGLWVFRASRPDLLILEVGLGGRLDAVNLVDPSVAVITSIGLDHQDWLGDSRDAIVAEKAGIRRSGRPLLYGEQDLPAALPPLAAQTASPLWRAGRQFEGSPGRLMWTALDGSESVLSLPPVALGEDNLATAVQAFVLALGRDPDPERIWGLAALSLPGRCQHLHREGVDWYLDAGHNREALARFQSRLPAGGGRTLAVVAMLGDKPADALAPFVPRVQRWYLADLPGPRAGTAARLQAQLPELAPQRTFATVTDAVHQARADARPGDRVLVFGSFHTVADAQTVLDS